MLRVRMLVLLAVTTLPVTSVWAADADEAKFQSLFNGQDLGGWDRHGGTANYAVEDGCIVGRTSEGSANSFLCTSKNYTDFEMSFEVKVDDELNSGVQIRSAVCSEKHERRVHGPQVEISTNGHAGSVWGEALGTGWLNPDADREIPEKVNAFRKGEWNEYRIRAVGPHIETWINGTKIADIDETTTGMRTGLIGLQVHGIKRGTGPYEVRWRKIQFRELGKRD